MNLPFFCGALSLLHSRMLAGLLKGSHQAIARLQQGNCVSQVQCALFSKEQKTSMQLTDS